jgi:glycerol-3-phosphate dehydrogenase
MYSPATGILDPFIYTIALAENACKNGVDFYFANEVLAINRLAEKSGGPKHAEDVYEIQTAQNTFTARWVINCAGLYSDKIARMLGINDYTIYPCRGEYFILDQKAGQY